MLKIKTGLMVLISAVVLAGCTTAPSTSNTNNVTPTSSSSTSLKSFTMAEIAQHDSVDSCYLLINGKVYDVTSFIPNHPGGNIITQGCGKDATNLFNTKGGRGIPHDARALEIQKGLLIGVLKQ